MQRREQFARGRVFIGGALFVCLALLTVSTQASSAEVQQARSVLEPAAASLATSSAIDCLPCAGCYAAPAPSTHGFGGEGYEPDAPRWRLHAALSGDSPGLFARRCLRAAVPVRIAFCRWVV